MRRYILSLACCVLWSAAAGQPALAANGSPDKRPAGMTVAAAQPGKLADSKPSRTAGQPAAGAAKAAPSQTQVTVEDLRLALHGFLERRYRDKVAEIEVSVVSPDEDITLPGGKLEMRIRPRALQESLGRRMFEVVFFIDRKEVRTLQVLAEVTLQADVLTVVRDVRPEETLEAEDVKVTRVALPAGAHDYLADFDQVVGRRVIRPLRAESPVRSSALAFPEIIKKGDHVTIEVKHGGLLIQANGMSKTGGAMGQSITVLNEDSKKEVRARIVGPGTVRVEF